jgi:hypothetical protein
MVCLRAPRCCIKSVPATSSQAGCIRTKGLILWDGVGGGGGLLVVTALQYKKKQCPSITVS